MKSLTFQQALKASKTDDPNSDVITFKCAEILSVLTGVNHKTVYDWAIEFDNDLKDIVKEIPIYNPTESLIYWKVLIAITENKSL